MTDPITTLLVDDEPLARDSLRGLLAEDPEIQLVGECEDGPEALEALERLRPQLAFFDVEMPGLDGIEVVRSAAATSETVVVFVTAYSQFAADAFDVDAADYVLKPFDDRRFFRALAKAKQRVRDARQDPPLERLTLRDPGRMRILPIDSIDWIAGAGNYAEIHAGDRSHLHRESLTSLLRRLDPARFLRVHRSAIVNVRRVAELEALGKGEYRLRLLDGTELRSSRSFRAGLARVFELDR